MQLRSVLVANRGEIAMRILRTLRELGITAVAVHTEEDREAPHVTMADTALRIDSYLDGAQIVAAAQRAGAQAVHPGYGFLSERAGFARACAEAGVVFIGPGAAAIETMGDKIAARAAVAARGVATVPGLAEPALDDAALIAGAGQVGFPLLIKPAAGGGGKGMHRVETPAKLPAALASARREAASATARAVDYVGAGTVEFLVAADAPDEPFFLEMNTRLQVEHPVTEAVTGLDLVAEQIRIASGQQLSLEQDQVRADGHAIEARLYAEDPDDGFLPTGGTVLDLFLPETVRIDHALHTGMTVSSSYDPLLAKLIAHAPTRAQALAALDRVVGATHVLGVVTNAAFLRALLAREDVAAGALDTGLIQRHLEQLTRPPVTARERAVAALVRWDHVARHRPDDLWRAPTGWRLCGQAPFRVRFATADGTPMTVALTGSPAAARARVEGTESDGAESDGAEFDGAASDGAESDGAASHGAESDGAASDGAEFDGAEFDGAEFDLALHSGAVTIDGQRLPLASHCTKTSVWIGLPSGDRELILHAALPRAGHRETAPALESPMPGTVTAVLVADGHQVAAGDPMLVVEAMKMEYTLHAPVTGTVRLHTAVGRRVRRGDELAQVIAADADRDGTPPAGQESHDGPAPDPREDTTHDR